MMDLLRRLRPLGLWALLLTGAAVWADEFALKLQKVNDRVYFVEGESAMGSSANRNFISNAGVVITPGGVVVIDALGSPALARALLAEIGKLTAQPVSHVIVTHYHADHIYGLQVFKAAGARVLAHEGARTYLNSDTARLRLQASRVELAPWIDDDTQLVGADQWIGQATDLVVGGVTLHIEPVGPAHTPEDLAVHVASDRVLFAGDLVFRGRLPFVGQADSRQWIQGLERLLRLDPAVLVPGHGPLSHNARADMELTRDYLGYLRATMGEAARNMDAFDDAYRSTDWSRFEHLPLFRAANRMNAYNTYLLMEHEAP